MRVAKKLENAVPKRLIEQLHDLADFMNRVRPGLSADEWVQWCEIRPQWMSTEGPTSRLTLEEASALRTEIHRDLTYMRWSDDAPFALIVNRLHNMPVKYQWAAKKFTKTTPAGSTILRGGKKQYRWEVESWTTTENMNDALYCRLGAAMRYGIIEKFRECSQCGKYFVGGDTRQVFCRRACRDTFHNRRKARDHKFKEYREAGRQKGIKKAKSLIKNGLSPRKVQAETRLPRKVIDELVEKVTS